MICERCGRENSEWRCSTCGKMVCTNCAKSVKGEIYCLDHLPEITKKEPEKRAEKAKGLKTLFYTLLILTIGLFGIYYIAERFISGNIPEAMIAVETLKSSIMIIIYGIAGLTLLVGLSYVIIRKI